MHTCRHEAKVAAAKLDGIVNPHSHIEIEQEM